MHVVTTFGQFSLISLLFCRLRSKVVIGGASVDSRFRHSQKLEELRNIQEQISLERAQWTKEKDAQEKWISEKKIEIQKKQVSSSSICKNKNI